MQLLQNSRFNFDFVPLLTFFLATKLLTYKFPISFQDVAFETSNNTGEDRIVRATLPATVKGTLLMPTEIRRSNIEKRFSVKKVVFGRETDGFNVSDAPQGGY